MSADIAGQFYRVSSDNEQSVEGQRPETLARIQAKGYVAGPEYIAGEDGVASAYKGEQRGTLDRAIEDMRNGVIDVLIVRHTDRLDRLEELSDILKRVAEAGGRIESLQEPWLEDVSGLGGKVMTGVTEWMNAEYSRKISRNVTQAHTFIRSEGYWVGSVPFGYVTVGATRRKVLTPDPVNAALVREVFQRVSDGRSASSVCAWLDAEAPQVIKKTGKLALWRTKRVCDMVRSATYKGQHPTHTGYEALVSKELWETANSALSARSTPTGGRKTVHGYSGLIFCPCGAVCYRHFTVRSSGPKYRCSKGRRNFTETTCGNKPVPFDAANAAIDAYMLEDLRWEYLTVTMGGDHERQARIAELKSAVAAALKASDYATMGKLSRELQEVSEAPATPVVTRPRKTGRRIAEIWEAGSLADRRSFLEGRAPVERMLVFREGWEVRARLVRAEDEVTEDREAA